MLLRIYIAHLQPLAYGCWRVRARFGFMERTDVPRALGLCARNGLAFQVLDTSFFLGREKIISVPGEGGMVQWREHLFATMARKAGSAVDYFKLPANRVIELGTQLEL